MSKTWRKLLSVLLALSMIVSLTVTGYATGNSSAASPTKASSGTKLELEEIDPGTLNVPRLGQITEDEEPGGEELPYKFGDIVRVSIVLDKAPTLEKYSVQNVSKNVGAVAYRAGLKHQQEILTSKIEATLGRKIDVKWNLTLAMNAISANVRYGDIAMIRTVEGVKSVELENRYEPQADEINTANTTEYMVGATALWENGYTGAGSRVAIIDTGTDQDHQSFDPEALEYALAEDGGDYNLLTWDEISGLAGQLNAPVTEEVYKNTKIPYAYNYVDGGYITDHMSDTQGEHGSHVSGIAAANRYVKIDGEFVNAAEKVFAVGVAPDAQILTMKVFGSNGGAYDSDYMVAIEDAIVLGCDSINLSLGSGAPGYTLSPGYQDVMNGLVECGSVVSISSGNSGAWYDTPYNTNMYPYLYTEDVSYHTGGSPGSFTNALTVASADNTGIVGSPLVFNGTQTGYPSETSGYGNEPIATLAGDNTYEYVLVDGPGVDDNDHVGQEGDAFMALGREVLEGKVAMCYRGSSSFFAKANAAAAQGAIAVIIINNTDGVINMNLTDYAYTAPAVSILKAVGDAVKAESEAVTDEEGNVLYYTGTMTIGEKAAAVTADRSEATISSFSSWGVPGSLILKPEITTPGGSIYSVWGANKGDSSPTDSHEDYELMSGTSMAAPHAAGMAALLGQYIRENNLEEVTGVNRRTLINSLLMSTATPMFDDEGKYYPVLQQGAGLGDTFAASQAKSFITMNEDATASWQDGKVKVELGQDAAREGVYNYSFNINNFSDVDMTYKLSTDIFTQAIAGNAGYGMLQYNGTMMIGADVTYDYPTEIPNDHDVNMDGKTDKADAQAILDKITGEYPEDGNFDEKAADMDGDGKYTSYDAQLLLKWLQGDFSALIVPAGQSVTVGVTITLDPEWTEQLEYYFPNGFYVEGYTYVTPTTETEDGEILGVEHSIPILGYYGSWTDPSMFDAVSAVDVAYGTSKMGYITDNTNYLTVNYGKGNVMFMGNPYMVEDEFPADRLALNENTGLVSFRYNMIRNAASTGFLALDENYNVLKGTMGGSANGAWYYVNGGSWQDIGTKTASIGGKVSNLGVKEGDTFTLGYFAVPEYYGMMLHPGEDVNTVTADEVGQLLASGELGEGAYIGYTFTVDNTAPVVDGVTVSDDGKTMTVTAHDDQYIACVMIMDVYGNTLYAQQVPEQTEPGETVEVEFEITEEMGNGVAVIAGDYACNEDAKLGKLSDEPITGQKTVYVPVTTLEDGKNYIFVSSKEAGAAKAIAVPESTTSSGYLGVNDVTVKEKNGEPYVEVEDVNNAILWSATAYRGDFKLTCSNKYMGYYGTSDGSAVRFWGSDYGDTFNVNSDIGFLYLPLSSQTPQLPVVYDAEGTNPVVFHREKDTYFYAFGEATIEEEFDPDLATDITVTPEEYILVLGHKDTVQLNAEVKPILLEDKSVTWSTEDDSIATVDENGLVTAAGVGTTTITATTNAEPGLTDTATIRVVKIDANADIRGLIYGDDSKTYWSIFNSDTPAEWTAEGNGGYYDSGALVDDTLYTVDGDSIYAVDADTYEVTTLGGIVADWCFSDGVAMPADLVEAWGIPGFVVGGPCYNGTYFEVLNPEEGRLNYWNLSSAYGSDPMATIAYIGRGQAGEANYYMLTEGGVLWLFTFDMEGSLSRQQIGETGLQLDGIASLNNRASMVYDEESDFLFLAYYDGNGNTASLYAIDPNEPTVNCELGDFGTNVWPVVSLYQYEPATDLVLKVNPTDVELFETQTAELKIKVKMGETNEYTAEVADPSIASFEDGVITGLKAGETTITITTVDKNAAGEQLTETVNVTVKPLTSIDAFVMGQVTDAQGTRFAKINLEDLSVSTKGVDAPGNVTSGARTGDIYMAGMGTNIVALDAEDMMTPATYSFDSNYAQYPAQDIANYPIFIDNEGELDEHKALFTTNLGWLVTPDYYGWNLSSYLPDMAAVAFAGVDENDDGEAIYVYYILTTEGVLYQIDVAYESGSINLNPLLETGITVEDQSALSMVFLQNVGFESGELALKNAGLVVANNEDQSMWYIDFLTGEVGLFGTLDATNVSGLIGTFDDLTTVVDPEDMPQPAPEIETIQGFYFEEDPAQEGWTFVDQDGDNYNWAWNQNIGSWFSGTPDYAGMAYEGEGCIASASYINTVGVLSPNNWAISPAIDLSDAEGELALSVYAKGLDTSYAAENFALYAGTSADPAKMVKISDDFTATGTYKAYTADLSDFAGESEVYVAIRHYNISDMYILLVDQVEIGAVVETAEPSAAPAVDLTKYAAPELNLNKVGDGCAMVGFTAPAAIEMTKFGESVNTAKGSLNAVNITARASGMKLSAVALDEEASTEETKVVNITEDVDVTNGKYVVTYDPEKLTYVSAECDHEIKSIHVDEEKGEITLAFADTDAVAAGETLATVTFTVACEDTEITVTTNERNDELELDETETIAIEGIGHDWGEPEWTWAEDYSTATATFVCGNNDEHVEEIEAVVTSETTDPTCTEAGETVYTATVTFEGKEYTDTKTESIEATGHDWGEPTWTWSDDNKTVTATFVCNNDESHTMTVEATVTEETTEPTCTEDGTITYTATVTGPDGKEYTDTNADTLPAKGHVWGEPVWTWSDDHKTATATFTCTECGETVTVTDSAILTDTTEDGKITYTASVIGPDGKTYTTTFVGGVDTGDTMNLSLYIGLMLVSAAGAIVLLRTLKKKEN